MKTLSVLVLSLLFAVPVFAFGRVGRSTKVVKTTKIIEPVTVVDSYATTSYVEVPNVELRSVERLVIPGNAYAVDSCGNVSAAVPTYSTYTTYVPRTVVKKLVQVQQPRKVVEKDVVVEKKVVKKNVKVVHNNRASVSVNY